MTVTVTLKISPNEEHWAGASEEQRQIYVQEELREHINLNLGDIVDFPIEYAIR